MHLALYVCVCVCAYSALPVMVCHGWEEGGGNPHLYPSPLYGAQLALILLFLVTLVM